jgi:hypothetical protein
MPCQLGMLGKDSPYNTKVKLFIPISLMFLGSIGMIVLDLAELKLYEILGFFGEQVHACTPHSWTQLYCSP